MCADFSPAFQPVADLIGLDAAQWLIDHYGGTILYVPSQPATGHLLWQMSASARARLCQHYGWVRIVVPLAIASERRRRDEAIAALAGVEPVRAIARRFGLTERGVYKVLRRMRSAV